MELDPAFDDSASVRPQRQRQALSAAMLQPVLRMVEAGLDGKLRVAELATTLGLSQFHFSREFRRVTGTSPYSYVLKRRIARSSLLLAGTDLPIEVVAGMVGFATHAHFSNAFLRAAGMTPRQYRSRHGRAAGKRAAAKRAAAVVQQPHELA